MKLRAHQSEAIEALFKWFEHSTGNPLVVLPTAAGKSVVQAEFVRMVLSTWPGQRILLVSHVKELLQQNMEKLLALWPEARIGVYSAGLKRREVGYSIQIAGIQSIYNKTPQLGSFDLMIVDECHLIPKAGDGMYLKFVADQRALNPAIKVIGLTATHYRLGTGLLHEGENKLFDGIAYEVGVRRLITEGWLSDMISKRAIVQADLDGVGTRGGEFIQEQLAEAMDKEELTRLAVDEMVKLCADRKSWIIFCASVEHAKHVQAEIQARGISCGCVHGDTPSEERAFTLEQFKSGAIRALTNMNVLTTGFDAPNIDALIMLRPTKSTGLYVQMVGRGMRVSPGKTNCLVLDFARNIERHGPIDAIQVKSKTTGGGGGVSGAPTKVCPECQEEVAISIMLCPDCGYVWLPKPKHEHTASFADVLQRQMDAHVKTYKVDRVAYSRHEKQSDITAPNTVRVDYFSGMARFSEWVCFDHEGFARRKAESWWEERAPGVPPPPCVNDFLSVDRPKIKEPESIIVNSFGKYPTITKFNFTEK